MPTDTVKAHPCDCVATHSPAAYVPNNHHVVPVSWGGQTVASNLIWLCPNAHTAVHELLNLYTHAGGTPPITVLQHYTALVRETAARGWAGRPNDHPPYTEAHIPHVHDSHTVVGGPPTDL